MHLDLCYISATLTLLELMHEFQDSISRVVGKEGLCRGQTSEKENT
jgi:hypothetical protein